MKKLTNLAFTCAALSASAVDMTAYRAAWAAEEDRVAADIRANRMSDVTVSIEGVRPGDEVDIRQVSHDFRFGSNCLVLGQLKDPAKAKAYEAALKKLFNLVTTTACLGVYEKEPGKFRFADNGDEDWRRPPMDRIAEWSAANGIACKGQPLLAGSWHPAWAKAQTIDEAHAMYVDYFTRVAARYGDKYAMFDVVNEAFCHKNFPLYTDDWSFVDWALETAGPLFPTNVALCINEYSAVNGGIRDFRGFWDRSGDYYNLAKRVLDKGLRLDGLGMQFHMFTNAEFEELLTLKRWTPQDLRKTYDRYATLGIPLYITEVTIPSTLGGTAEGEKLQAEVAENLYRFWFSQKAFDGITWWNLCDGAAWLKEGDVLAGLLDADMREKPVYQMLYQLIRREWTTNLRAKVDAAGQVKFRGFHGDYEIAGQRFHVGAQGPQAVTVKLPAQEAAVTWTDAKDLTFEGQGFTDTESAYDRLPASANGKVPPRVWSLSRHATGMAVRFVAEGRSVKVRCEGSYVQPMHRLNTRCYVAGCDVYWKMPSGAYRFYMDAVPDEIPSGPGRYENSFSIETEPGTEYLMYLPSRTRLSSVKLGGAVRPAPARASGVTKPVVHYGTSIVHGGLCSRPGQAFAAIEGRTADVPLVNLGFSGSGRLEPALADELVKIDAALYIVDCGWNCSRALLEERLEPFVRKLAAARPGVPILLPGCCSGDLTEKQHGNSMGGNTQAIRATYEKLVKEPAFAQTLHYLGPEEMLPQDGDATGDHCHPNDYGMQQMGRTFGAKIRSILCRD